MEIAKLVLEYIQSLIWPSVVIFSIIRFREELKGLLAKAIRSHEVEVDILGQKIKLKTLEKLAEEGSDTTKAFEENVQPNRNALLTMHLINLISKLSTDEIFVLRRISLELTEEGYCGCEAERLVLEKFTNQKILNRDERGFYHPTDLGKRLMLAMKTL